jgi:cbb3-type cytochrome oxidase subunit 1
MDSMNNWALKFVRWGMGLTILGLLTGYIPLGHYLMKDSLPSCPAAPVHGHTILLSFIGMTMFGLAYRALPAWMGTGEPPVGLVRTHFWLAVVGIIGVCVNGTLGYEYLALLVQPGFYYIGDTGQTVRNLWFGIDGAFLTLYAIGCVIFLYIVMKKTTYTAAAQLAA